ncbi:MAG: hypothetical protein ACRECZ_08875 [Methylocella sp.]
MTANPKSAVAEAIAHYDAAQAAFNANTDDSDETSAPLCEAANDALGELARTPCADDAEFLEKLRHLLDAENFIHGGKRCDRPFNMGFGSILVAVATHFERGCEVEDEAEEK